MMAARIGPSGAVRYDVRIVRNDLPKVPTRANRYLDEEFGRTAQGIERGAKLNNRRWGLIDTGRMINGWMAERAGLAEWYVYTDVDYALYWEMGHQGRAPRPMLRPAWRDETRKMLDRIARRGMEGALRRL